MSEHTLSWDMNSPSPLSGRRAQTSRSSGLWQPLAPTARHLYRSDPSSSDSPPAFGSGMSSGGSAASASGPGSSDSSSAGDQDSKPRPRRRGGRRSRGGRGASSGEAGSPDAATQENSEGPASSMEESKNSESGSKRKTSRPRRRPRKRATADGSAAVEGEKAPDDQHVSKDSDTKQGVEQESTGDEPKRSRRRGRRGGRRRRKADEGEPEGQQEQSTDAAESGEAQEPGAEAAGSKSRRYASKRGRTTKASANKRSASDAEGDSKEGSKSKPAARKRGSRGGRGRRKSPATAVEIESIPFEDDDLPQLQELPEEAVILNEEDSGRGRSKRTKRSKKSKTRRKSGATEGDGEASGEEVLKNRQILVNAGDPEETRVTVVEDGRIVELFMTVKKHTSYVSDIYRGRVVNIESAIGAAFVDFGQGKNGFLHASDVLESYGDPKWDLEQLLNTPVDPEAAEQDDEEEEDEEPEGKSTKGKSSKSGRGRKAERSSRRTRTPIDKLVKKGQMVAVQITKDAIGDKGPTLTTYVSIPGRYLVLMPSLERTGVSRKIEDEKERRRLKRILTALKIPDGMGVIVRTAGVGKTKAELKRDLDYLLLAWDDFAARLKGGRNPTPLYQESEVAIRTMRDLFTTNTEVVIVDDEHVYQRMVEFTERLMPEYVSRIKRHEGVRPLLQSHGVEQDFEKIFQRRVELPSGGSIVIDQTEALVAIDVNSGRTRQAGAEFEDIALKTNLEAVAELSRQIRLRDLGGIIVLDYIDMMRASSRRAVETATREAFKDDRARSKIGRISQFGLLELTRQRLGPGLTKLVYDSCTRCKGSGRRRNASSRAQSILRRLGASLVLKGFSSVEVRAHPEVIEYLEKELPLEIKKLEEASGRTLILMSVPDQAEDSVLHYKRADGREVRPGGRRKR